MFIIGAVRGFFVDPPEKHMKASDFTMLPLTYHLAHNTSLMPLFDALLHADDDAIRRREKGRDWAAVQAEFPNQWRGPKRRGSR